MTRAKHLRSRGFTLVEILVVIGIIAAITAISLVALAKIEQSGREKVTQARLAALKVAIADFLAEDTFNADELPEERGGPLSSKQLYILLSGDTDANGVINGNEVAEAALYPELRPPVNANGKIDFTSADCMVRNVEEVNGVWQVVQESEGDLGPNFVIVDAFQRPIRFWYVNGKGQKNNFKGGYDIWSAGQDGKTEEDPTTTASEANGMLDDIGNW